MKYTSYFIVTKLRVTFANEKSNIQKMSKTIFDQIKTDINNNDIIFDEELEEELLEESDFFKECVIPSRAKEEGLDLLNR